MLTNCDKIILFAFKPCNPVQNYTHTFLHNMTKSFEDTDTMAINRPSDSDSARADHSNVNVNIPTGWKYRRFFGLPYYASPQVQLVLVAFVCFLCPGTSKFLY